jgi:hypothetical protein
MGGLEFEFTKITGYLFFHHIPQEYYKPMEVLD